MVTPIRVLGLDVGVASVGWCLIERGQQDRIVDWGVRRFEQPVDPKTKISNAQIHRAIRGARKMRFRKKERLRKLRGQFRVFGWKGKLLIDAHSLRSEALHRLLSLDEWVSVLHVIAKRRGVRTKDVALSKEDKPSDEDQQTLDGVSKIRALMMQVDYETVGALLADPNHPLVKLDNGQMRMRSRRGYDHFVIPRDLLEREVQILFEKQRTLGSVYADAELQERVMHIIFHQRPFATRETMLKLIGTCTYYDGEIRPAKKRAPIDSITYERFVFLQTINHLRVNHEPITEEQRLALIHWFDHSNDAGEITYKTLRELLELLESARFDAINYGQKKAKKRKKALASDQTDEMQDDLKAEEKIITRARFRTAMRQCNWPNPSDRAFQDKLAWELLVEKEESKLITWLQAQSVTSEQIAVVLASKFGGTGNLSFQALNDLMPWLELGKAIKNAEMEAFSNQEPFRTPSIRALGGIAAKTNNLTVKRSTTQAIKVVQHVLRTYGDLHEIHVEVGREVGLSEKKKIEINKNNRENEKKNKQLREELMSQVPRFHNEQPKSKHLKLYELWKQQNGVCVYTGASLTLSSIFSDEPIRNDDHILPYSRTADDRLDNKVLCTISANAIKGNRTPHEWLYGTPEWDAFVQRAQALPKSKRDRLLKSSLNHQEEQEWSARSINDTNYISRMLVQHLKRYAPLSEHPRGKKDVIYGVPAQFVAQIRGLVDLNQLKDRAHHLHHAIDALLVAVSGPDLIARMRSRSRMKERLIKRGDEWVDRETGEMLDRQTLRKPLEPWEFFQDEVFARLGMIYVPKHERTASDPLSIPFGADPEVMIDRLSLPSYQAITQQDRQWIRPIFPSVKEDHRVSGKAHGDTVMRYYEAEEDFVTQKTDVNQYLGVCVNEAELDKKIANIHGNDEQLKSDLRKHFLRLLAVPKEEREAALTQFPRKTCKKVDSEGRPILGPLIKTLNVKEKVRAVAMLKDLGNDMLRGGIRIDEFRFVEQVSGGMIASDWFEREGKWYTIPLYVADTVRENLPAITLDGQLLDPSFEFRFRLMPNDYVKITYEDGSVKEGYYCSLNITHQMMRLKSAYSNDDYQNNAEFRVSTKSKVKKIEKFRVDILGNVFPVKREVRKTFR